MGGFVILIIITIALLHPFYWASKPGEEMRLQDFTVREGIYDCRLWIGDLRSF